MKAMAELNYNDVQRVVQDAIAGLRNDLQRALNDIHSAGQAAQRIDDIEREVLDVKQMLQVLHTNLIALRPGGSIEQHMGGMMNDISDAKQRLVNIEHAMSGIQTIMQQQINQELEDQQYRSA